MARRRRPPRPGALTELPPLKIIGQMAALQAAYYTAAFILLLFNAMVSGQGFKLDLVFGWAAVRGDTTQGWLMAFLWILDGGLFLAVAMVLVVVRSKLVPDFALTTHFLHLVIASFYTGQVPRNTFWWASMFVSSALGISLGMWGCRYRELRPISFGGGIMGGGGGGSSNNNNTGGASGNGEGSSRGAEDGVGIEGDEEQGFSRGRGRGRGRDGAGDYEMVKMNGEAAP